nr:unnamed protein product [Callosobruchus analis]
MTTSQASRIFGIPYNSLLMYVRGKPSSTEDPITTTTTLPVPTSTPSSGGGGGMTGGGGHPPPHSLFNPFPAFYPDFPGSGGGAPGAAGFPIPVSMIHLLPQSEKSHFSIGNADVSIVGLARG